MPYTESNYENAIIDLFQNELNYDHVYAPDIERDFRSPLYNDVLEESLLRINKGASYDAVQDALFKLRNFENGELVQKNAVFMDYLQNGIQARYTEKGEERSTIIYLVDYENVNNNSFIIANQWTFVENSEKRPDIILFLNGLPIVMVELKSPSREQTDASEAYLQLRNYMHDINELLKHSIKSDGVINLFSDIHEEFSLFDPSFLEEVSKIKERNLAVELLKKLIAEQISVYRRTNVVKSEKFSEIIQRALNAYLNGMLTNEEVIAELMKLAKEIAQASKEGDALTKPQAVKDFYENAELIAITTELT